MEKPRAGMFRYIKEAFLFRWNMLAFGGAAAMAALSGHIDVALPLVAAAEVTYLAGLSTLPRYQAAIDAKSRAEHGLGVTGPAQAGPVDHAAAKDRIVDVLRSLSDERRSRFLRLRARCVEMQRIANAVRGETTDTSGANAELRTPALDRLLWVFLKLLLSEQAITRFLQAADEGSIERSIADIKFRISKRNDVVAEAERADDRILKSLNDSVATAQARKDNIVKARGNAEFVSTELERLENKIAAVTEMAVGETDPDQMSSRIDAISEGISQTEATIRELQKITGITDAAAEQTPGILDMDIGLQAKPPKTPGKVTQ
ncbi:MAG TPA: hypothetical protein VGM88_35245 [Kofleriaceae bacterium]|jgi:hypothetical protein